MKRRTFLAQLAAVLPAAALAEAGPFIYGLGDLFAQSDKKTPAWLNDALRKMKETGRYGIVLVVPDKKEEQRLIGCDLAALVDGEDRATHAILSEAVFVCLRRFTAEGVFCEIGDKNTRYLLDPSGKRLDADKIDRAALESEAAFTTSFGRFLHGKSGERLRERSDAVRKSLPAEVPQAVEQLDAEEVEAREKASASLLKHADRIMPFLADLSVHATSVERRGRAADVIEAWYRASPAKATGPRLPYGCKIPQLVSAGCGGVREKEDGEKENEGRAVACGMAKITPETARFMKWLSFLKE